MAPAWNAYRGECSECGMIYLDMDGVLADFDAGLRAIGIEPDPAINKSREHMTPEEIERKNGVYATIMARTGFFSDLPPMPDMQELWGFCETFNPVILTAAPRSRAGFEKCSTEKYAWVRKHLGPIPERRFVCTVSSRKASYLYYQHGRFQILVDDRRKNCEAWRAAGGIAVEHVSARESIFGIEREISKGVYVPSAGSLYGSVAAIRLHGTHGGKVCGALRRDGNI